MQNETILNNARVVLKDEVVRGSVCMRDGVFAGVSSSNSSAPQAQDMGGDYLLPGFIELHTDNLEKHFMPRPKVLWPAQPATIAHDAQLIAAGITTVFDAVAVGEVSEKSQRVANLKPMLEAVQQTQDKGLLRAEHFVHLRCELCYPKMLDLFAELLDLPEVHMVSLMDHSPGQRQFVDTTYYRIYYQGKLGFSDAEIDQFMQEQKANSAQYSDKQRKAVVQMCRDKAIPLASHDDATEAHVQEAAQDGVSMAEFPTTKVAARASHAAGMGVLMGAPNVVRGGSHSGNIAAHELATEGVLDILSSDYCPTSLLNAVFVLAEREDNDYDLAQATRTASYNPAVSAKLPDRGEIAQGKRADIIRVAASDDHPYVKRVWSKGEMVF